jgi:hypothetical protein
MSRIIRRADVADNPGPTLCASPAGIGAPLAALVGVQPGAVLSFLRSRSSRARPRLPASDRFGLAGTAQAASHSAPESAPVPIVGRLASSSSVQPSASATVDVLTSSGPAGGEARQTRQFLASQNVFFSSD